MAIEKFFPLPGLYGVMQIDTVATVAHLHDEKASEAAKAVKSQKYIGYIYDPIELPFPGRPWYGYQVMPIGTTLRAEEPEQALTADMCVPIAPNSAHPTSRASIATEPPFPFSNCYHWVDSETRVRIRGHTEYDEMRAVGLPPARRVDLLDLLDEDLGRADDILEEREAARAAVLERTTGAAVKHEDGRQHGIDVSNVGACGTPEADSSPGQSECSCSSCGASSRTLSSERSPSVDSLQAFVALDPLGFKRDAGSLYFPLIDFCVDITDHVTQDEIGSPVDFWRERDELVSIIQAAEERAARRRADARILEWMQ